MRHLRFLMWLGLVFAWPASAWAFTNTGITCNAQNGASSSGTVACTSSAVSAGSLMVVWVASSTTTVSTVADDKSDSCVVGTKTGILTPVYCPNLTSGATVFTATLAASVTHASIWASNYTGVGITTPLDKTTAQAQTTPGTGANAVTSGNTAALTTAPELVVAASINSSGSAGAGTINIGTGYTADLSTASLFRSEYKVVTATTAVAGTFTAGSASDSFDTAVMTFLPSLSASQLQGYAVMTTTGPSASQLQGYAILAQGMNTAQLQGYAVLTQALNVAQMQGYAILCQPPGVGACPAGPPPAGLPQVTPFLPAGSTMTR